MKKGNLWLGHDTSAEPIGEVTYMGFDPAKAGGEFTIAWNSKGLFKITGEDRPFAYGDIIEFWPKEHDDYDEAQFMYVGDAENLSREVRRRCGEFEQGSRRSNQRRVREVGWQLDRG
jgi:hypothetical protein